MNPKFKALTPYLERKRKLHYLSSVLNYDIETTCPSEAIEDLANILSGISVESCKISQDKEFIHLVKEASREEDLNPYEKRFLERELENIEFLEKVTPEQLSKWNLHASKSNEMWKKCKAKGDYASWLPYFEEVIKDTKEQCRLKQKEGETLYDVCLRGYEPGNNIALLDSVFHPLKEYLLKKIPEVLKKQEGHKTLESLSYPKVKQEALSNALLRLIGYNLDQGVLRESEHPFSDNLSIHDARITTNYSLEDFRSSMYSVLHEGGHAIQFQNWPKEQYDHFVEGFASYACCETHSRFFENILGRSPKLIPVYRKILAETLDPKFKDIDDETLFALGNEVKPIVNRCDSDELTYSLHIILRYEIEKALLNGELEPKDIPTRWNALTEEYLGVKVPHNGEGCMQDVHWTDGSFGYFPSYALGNLYGAMILERMKEDLDVDALLSEGNFKPILAWLKENDFAYDYLKPNDWIKKVTGKSLDPQAFIRYLESKY